MPKSPKSPKSPNAPPSPHARAGYIFTVARLTLLEAARTRLPWLILIVIAISLGLAKMLDQVAILETEQIQATLIGALFRIAAVFVVVTFVITSVVRESADKVSDLLLSQAVPRFAYYAGKLAGHSSVCALITLAFALPLVLFSDPTGVGFWAISLLGELVLMAAASLFFVLTLTQVVPAMSTAIAFYLLSRSMAAVQLLAAASLTHSHSMADQVMNGVVSTIALLLPNLGSMTLSEWILRPPEMAAFVVIMAQILIYIPLLAGASLFDLYRRNF